MEPPFYRSMIGLSAQPGQNFTPSQPDRDRPLYLQPPRLHGALQSQHLHSGPGRPAQGRAELRMGGVVGLHPVHSLHLDDKAHPRLIARLTGRDQLLQVLQPPEGRGVGEAGHAGLLQGDPLHLPKAPAQAAPF